jgi:putative hydrolase of the HAD superfamily
MAELRGVIVDLDGLLIDSEMWSWQAHNAALREHGLRPISLDEVRRLVGLAGEEEWQVLRQMRDVPGSRLEFDILHREAYIALRDRSLAPMPGVRELLEVVRRAGLRLAVASNSGLPHITAALMGLGIRTHFMAVCSGTETARGKPAPDVYQLAMARINVLPDEGVAIEDSLVGVTAAKAAGLVCLAVPNEITIVQDLTSADCVLNNLHETAIWLTKRLADGI